MNTFTKYFQVPVLIFLFIVAFFNTQACADESDTIERSFTVQPGGQLNLESDRGSIRIETHNKNSVDVVVTKRVDAFSDTRAREIIEGFEISFNQSGDNIEIQGKARTLSSDAFNRLRLQYVVTVPLRYDLELRTAGGSINVADIEGEVDAKTAGGSLTFGNVVGTVEGKTAGGSISLNVADGNVDVRTSGGSISIGGAQGDVVARTSGGSISIGEVYGMLDARTAGGSINIKGVTGTVDARTSGGSVQATILQQPDEDCTLKTSGGSISVTLPENIALDIDARSHGGKIKTDLPITVRGEISKSRIEGVLNGGGPTLTMETSAGNIIINKGRDVL